MRHDVVNVSRLNVAIVSAGCAKAVTGALLCGVADAAGGTWLLDRANDGWYYYYVVRLPLAIQRVDSVDAAFWSHDLVPPMPIACALGLAALMPRQYERRGRVLFYSLLTVGLVGSAWLSRLHAGAHPNVLMPAHAAIAVLLGLFLGQTQEVSPVGNGPRPHWPPHVTLLVSVQFAMLLADPRLAMPSSREAAMGRQLVSRIASARGEVWLPQHGYLGSLAGKRTYAHSMAMYDVIRAGDPRDRDHLVMEVRETLGAQQFELVIVDRAGWMRPDLERAYEPAGPVFPSPTGFWTLTGMRLRPQTVYTPRCSADALPRP